MFCTSMNEWLGVGHLIHLNMKSQNWVKGIHAIYNNFLNKSFFFKTPLLFKRLILLSLALKQS